MFGGFVVLPPLKTSDINTLWHANLILLKLQANHFNLSVASNNVNINLCTVSSDALHLLR